MTGPLNVIDVIPGNQGYTDFWHGHKVTGPEDSVANTATGIADIEEAGFDIESMRTIKNCPVVPDGSTASMRAGDADNGRVEGWNAGQVVSYLLFEEAALSTTAGGAAPTSPIFVAFYTNPSEDGGEPASGFMTESDSEQTHHVVATLPDDDGYSPL